ncbi:putative alkaline shock family protein YloU [Friedmanniella endophytica]|uniref:Putative alkaline shock family protein YloU n=1 Tax=Microlunatus kandeliicorticis TaxID=1759536 RepID=A0A7W3IVY2_9ACTN|nr:Asp23/Gls24 family envelope stress response protein [Microlunatus kandeliicorticis]MBA8796237.1 putative alkaline shock family protein YloU [Microlunatus kandeliicorticis]
MSAPSDGRVDPRRRGRLELNDRVVEKIAGQAAAEIGAAHGRSGGFLGIGAEADAAARPKVDVDLGSDYADLAITVGIAYPGSIRAAAQQIRDHVTERVQTLTGVRVHRVDIDVTFLTVGGSTHDDHQEVLR